MKRRSVLKFIPVFILYVIIFRFLYMENGFTSIINVCIPVFLGLFIAVVLNPVLIFFQSKLKVSSRGLAILITYIVFFGIIALAVVVVMPSVIQSIMGFVRDIPKLIAAVNKMLIELSENYHFTSEGEKLYYMLQEYILEYAQKLTSVLTSILNVAIGKVINVFAALWNFILAVIISVYILIDKEEFENWFFRLCQGLFEKKYADEIINIGYGLNTNVTRFISGKLLDSLIIGAIAYGVSEYIIKAPYAVIIGLLIGVTNMIPYFGPFIGGIPVTIITLLFNPAKGAAMGIFILILQQFDGLLLGPKILGIQLSIKPIIIIISIIIGGGLFGPIGMFLATPVAALLKTSIDGYVAIKLKDRDIKLPHQENESD